MEDVLHRRAHVGDQRGELGDAAGPVTHVGDDADEPAVGGKPTLDHAAERGHVDVAAAQRDDHLRTGRHMSGRGAGMNGGRRAFFPLRSGVSSGPPGRSAASEAAPPPSIVFFSPAPRGAGARLGAPTLAGVYGGLAPSMSRSTACAMHFSLTWTVRSTHLRATEKACGPT